MNTRTTGDGFLTVSFLLQNYTKMLKSGLNTELFGNTTIKLRKLDVKKLTRHKLSNKQSFKLSTIIDRKTTRNPEIMSSVSVILTLGNYLRQHRTIQGARLAFSYSVSLPKKSRQGDSLTSIYLYNLTKNLEIMSKSSIWVT